MKKLTMYAWVGEDDGPKNTGVIGLKQGIVAAGTIPLAAMDYHFDRLLKLLPQMEYVAGSTGKRRYLVKFEMVGIALETAAGEPWTEPS